MSASSKIFKELACAYPHNLDHDEKSYPAGRKFSNKLSVVEKQNLPLALKQGKDAFFMRLAEVTLKTQSFRMIMFHDRRDKIKLLESNLNNLPFSVTTEWKMFFSKIIYVATGSKYSIEGYGKCDEATLESLGTNLLKQLESDHFFSMQLLALSQDKKNHNVILYNASLITLDDLSQLHSSDDIKKFLAEIASANEEFKVSLCDPWLNFHGSVTDWYNAVSIRTDHDMQLIKWDNINVNNFSFPAIGIYTEDNYSTLKEITVELLKNNGAIHSIKMGSNITREFFNIKIS